MSSAEPWWVNGVLYENCNCQLLCPAHVSFRQRCEADPWTGFWGIRVAQGRFGPFVLGRQNALILYDSPSFMHEGGWTVQFCLDAGAEAAQPQALERILSHGSSNVTARSFTWKTMEKHALYSDISWTGP